MLGLLRGICGVLGPKVEFVFKNAEKVGHAVGQPIRPLFLDGGAAAVGFFLGIIQPVEEGTEVDAGTLVQVERAGRGMLQGGFIMQLAANIPDIITNGISGLIIGDRLRQILLREHLPDAGKSTSRGTARLHFVRVFTRRGSCLCRVGLGRMLKVRGFVAFP